MPVGPANSPLIVMLATDMVVEVRLESVTKLVALAVAANCLANVRRVGATVYKPYTLNTPLAAT